MASVSLGLTRHGLRAATWDTVMIALAAAQGVVLVAAPNVLVIAVELWWNSNTISHNFIHRPFFRRRWANVLFGAYLSVLLGFLRRCGAIDILLTMRACIAACDGRVN
jgi:fatty acid desaturase